MLSRADQPARSEAGIQAIVAESDSICADDAR
jgi:hypothetical protein